MSVVVDPPTVVHTSLGALRGTTEGGVSVWRGVSYAERASRPAPVPAPEPLAPWSGIRDALEHGPVPPQGRSFVGGGRDDPKIRDEACLTVTVWSPRHAAGTALPVMVWIPGGAFVYGAGQLQLYNGSRLAANGNVVVVNVTYRLGVFGGFELGDLGTGFDDNLCLRDQIAALRWVQDNIAAFGGDPKRVTVFGESAGATSVLALLASPPAGGLHPGDRPESRAPAHRRPGDAGATYGRLVELLDSAEQASLPHRSSPSRRCDPDPQSRDSPTLAFGLTYGVELLPLHPIEAASAGAVSRSADRGHEQSRGVDVRLGQTADAADDDGSVDTYFARRAPHARDRVLAAYPDYPRRRALIAVGADVMFCAPAWAFADTYSAHAPTHVYRFDHAAWSSGGCSALVPPTAARSSTSSTATARISAASCIRWAVGCNPRSAVACSARG